MLRSQELPGGRSWQTSSPDGYVGGGVVCRVLRGDRWLTPLGHEPHRAPDRTAITFAIGEQNENLAVARLAFLAHGDHPALDAAIEACLARRDRSLHTRWRAISMLVRVRYE
jgi:hypothetical protein